MSKALVAALAIASITLSYANETITIGASPIPHAQMLQFIQPTLAKQGYNLKIIEFTDYITPNLALAQKQIDANFFQHQPYLNQYNQDHHSDIVALIAVHLEPMGIYADKTTNAKFCQSKKAADLVTGSKVGVPNDPTNEGRALNLLQSNNIIKIKANVAYPTKKDVIANPYKIQIIELDPAMLPRSLSAHQLNLALINSNFALQAHLNPLRDAIILESINSPFVNIIATRPDELKQPKIQALAKAMTSPAMKQFIAQKYNGAIIAAF